MKIINFLGMTLLIFLLLIPTRGVAQERLLIIAPDDFIEELQPLKKLKDVTGRPTLLMSLTEIYNNANCNGADTAEEVKKCIAYFEEHENVRYVIIAGDVDKFPVRWTWWGLPGQENWAVSDLYFADLYENGTRTFDDWDANNNGLYGEIEFAVDRTINNDHIDFIPDVAVGRIPASSEAEITAYVNKVIAYEIVTNPSDAWFRTAALYTGCADGWDNFNKDEVGKSLTNSGFTVLPTSADDRLRYGHWLSPCPPAPAPCCEPALNMPDTVVNDMNNGVGFANYIGHGNIWGWA